MSSSSNQQKLNISNHLESLIKSNQPTHFILSECEDFEIEYLSIQKVSIDELNFYYCCFMLCYMIENDLNNCRFLWKRLPTSIKKSSGELKSIWTIAKNLWNKNYEGFYQSVQHALQGEKNENLKQLLQILVQRLQMRTIELVSTAYTNIKSSKLCKLLGVNPDNLSSIIGPLNWKFDNDVYYPKKLLASPPKPLTGLNAIQSITKRSVFLELE
jgi:COP9 signalosome complex subunit 8